MNGVNVQKSVVEDIKRRHTTSSNSSMVQESLVKLMILLKEPENVILKFAQGIA